MTTGQNNLIIDELLAKYQPVIGKDFYRYRNHVTRVYRNCLLLDQQPGNQDKYAYAAVFHDIGIWTNNTIDYLQPSIAVACEYLAGIGKKDWIAEITLMIYWHHKITRYNRLYKETVEVFRKADWIDVSLGVLAFGATRSRIRENREQLPNLGFHMFLLRKLGKNLLKHPLNPLPMFTR
ncbi:hypothetical protein [Flavihumibacter petaseus]|uniref:HD domain-containing protein n=1 Tax=Flavihumibacter petaseus NBRC 106054 TaxID=1220578 RepID=A0A0E9N4T9_9BACT|nr:hypothetical protein [Flavihumibacter petaseus]GAO44696.1 hypothetical protein FPE01S_03_07350 [Flavihumibacter petaseus NBRC 106054]